VAPTASTRTAVLIIRIWSEQGSAVPRARIFALTGTNPGETPPVTVAGTQEIIQTVWRLIERFERDGRVTAE
jgi:hypothetical protein